MVEKNDTKEWLETSPSNDPLYIMVKFSWNRWLKMSTRADEETTPKEREKKKKKKEKKNVGNFYNFIRPRESSSCET